MNYKAKLFLLHCMLEWSRFIEITRKQMVFFCKQRNHWKGCWTNFLLSEANWPSDCNPSHLGALRGNILTHHYCSMRLLMSQNQRNTQRLVLLCGKLFLSGYTWLHMYTWSRLLRCFVVNVSFVFVHRCENCVEMLFARGSGSCVQCDTPLRKSNFRVQLFEDPTIDKEVEIRKKVMKMWVRGWPRGRWVGFCVFMSCHASSLFLSCLCLSHYTVCFVDNESPQGGLKWEGSFPARFLLRSPSLPSFPASYLLFNSPLIDI